jgi:hypothetical protein
VVPAPGLNRDCALSWAPEGARLAYGCGTDGGARILDLATGSSSMPDAVGTWSPDGRLMVTIRPGVVRTPNLGLADYATVDTRTGRMTPLPAVRGADDLVTTYFLYSRTARASWPSEHATATGSTCT